MVSATSRSRSPRRSGPTTAATCGPANVDFVRSLGADLVIDYSKEDFTRRPEHYDVICDAVAMSSFGACRHLLNPAGAYVTTLPEHEHILLGGRAVGRGALCAAQAHRFVMVRPEGADLAFLGQLADQGRLKPTIARTFPLDAACERPRPERARPHPRQDRPRNIVIRIRTRTRRPTRCNDVLPKGRAHVP